MNAFNEYNGFAEEDGIPTLSNFDILLTNGFGGASTPMLDHLNGPVITEVLSGVGISASVGLIISAFAPITGLSITGPLMNATTQIWVFAPDMTFNMDWDEASDQIKETFFHEFAHASHFQNVPNSYWVDNIVYVVGNEINNNSSPYGTLETPGSGRTGVIEMWGFHYGPTLADRQYGLEHSNSIPFGTSAADNSYISILEGLLGSIWEDGVIPSGLPHDLIDENTAAIVDGVMNDNLGGFTQSAIFNELNGDVLSPLDFRIRLLEIAPSGVTDQEIIDLFGDYGF